ncbi:MAG: hypothetical protein AB8B49_03050 [Nitratireductor sp.]
MKELAGKYSGRGTAKLVGDKSDKVICKIENSFDSAKHALSLAGNCASVKGKASVNGKVINKGGKISGVLVRAKNTKVTKSHGEYKNGSLTLFTTTVDEKNGSISKVRQKITKTSNGINTVFHRFDNKQGAYLKVGELKLKRL